MTVGVSRDIIWVSSSLEDLKRFPESVQKVMGFALFQAQCGGKHLLYTVRLSERKARTHECRHA